MNKKIILTGLLSLLFVTGCRGNDKPSVNTEAPKPSETVPDTTVTTEQIVTTEPAVTTEKKDYGTLSFGMHQVREGYSRKITPRFSDAEVGKTEVLHYTSPDESGLTIDEDGTMHGIKAGSYKVSVTSEHFKPTYFYAHVISDSRFGSTVTGRFNNYVNGDYPEKGRTLFAGDSFFDTQFWSNFYSSYYGNYNTYTMGISATQADDWFYYAEKLIIPFEPENVVFHLGTNDINDAGKSGEDASKLLIQTFEKIHESCPDTKIYIFGIEASTAFPQNLAKELKANELTKAFCEANSYMTYLDSPSLFMNEAGTGADGSMLRDGLHPKLENYALYDNLLKEAGLNMTLLPGKEDPALSKKQFLALNAANDNYVTRGEKDSSLIIDAKKSGQNATPNRLFYSADGKNMYKGDLLIKGKVKYTDVPAGNHFLEMYFGPEPGLWATPNTFQFLLWNERAVVFNGNGGEKPVKADTDYDFTVLLSKTKAYVKFMDEWYSKDLGLKSGFAFSSESMTGHFTSLSVTTDTSKVTAEVPSAVNYTF